MKQKPDFLLKSLESGVFAEMDFHRELLTLALSGDKEAGETLLAEIEALEQLNNELIQALKEIIEGEMLTG